MRYKNIVSALVCGLVLGIAVSQAGEVKSACVLFDKMNLDALPPLVKEAAKAGDCDKAARLYKDIFIDRASRMSIGAVPSLGRWSYTKGDDLLYGWIAYPSGGAVARYNVGLPSNVKWRDEAMRIDVGDMQWTNSLATAYAQRKLPDYLISWTQYWRQFSQNYPVEKRDEDLTAEEKSVLRLRAESFLKCVSVCSAVSPDFAKRIISGTDLTAILARLAAYELPSAAGELEEMISSDDVVRCASILIYAAAMMPELEEAEIWRGNAITALKKYINDKSPMPDGSNIEQTGLNASFIDLCNMILPLAQLAAQAPQGAGWAQEIETMRSYASRFSASLVMPDGRMPALGCGNNFEGMLEKITLDDGGYTYSVKKYPNMLRMNNFEYKGTADFALKEAINNGIWGGGEGRLPAFTSIYFPYGGYAVSRGGWNDKAMYSFMTTKQNMGGCRGGGVNGLSICAYGRYLLVDSGYKQGISDAAWDNYFRAAVSRNTAGVDGFSQSGGDSTADKVLDAKWHGSDELDYMEGCYTGAYGGWNFITGSMSQDNDIKDVGHRRQVLALKKYGIWIVVDTFFCKQKHDFTISWNLSPHFMDKEVIVDQAGGSVVTEKQGCVNLELYFTSPSSLTISKSFGIKSDNKTLGWIAADGGGNEAFVPVANICVNLQSGGEQSVVTIIAARADSNRRVANITASGSVTQAVLNDGTKIIIQACPRGGEFKYNGCDANAQFFTAVEKEQAAFGAAIDCGIARGGDVLNGCFEFKRDADKITAIAEIKTPQNFEWIVVDGNLVPRYYK